MAAKKKVIATVAAVATSAALLLGGTLAWQSANQTALNEASDVINPGGRLHDDFDGTNKDVYVENFAEEDIFARVRLEEYFEIITNYGNADAETVHVIVGSRDDEMTNSFVTENFRKDGETNLYEREYAPYDFTDKVSNENGVTTAKAGIDGTDNWWTWTLGGETTYMPTFNKNKDSLAADLNGVYADAVGGISNRDDANDPQYVGYVDYSDPENATKDGTEIYDGDANTTDEVGTDFSAENLAAKEQEGSIVLVSQDEDGNPISHTAKTTENGSVISMAEWNALNEDEKAAQGYWVYDTDGWVYWSQPIKPGTATGLLLNNIELNQKMDDTWYYAINVIAQFITADDSGFGEGTGFYDTNMGTVPTKEAETLLREIGVTSLSDGEQPGEDESEPDYTFELGSALPEKAPVVPLNSTIAVTAPVEMANPVLSVTLYKPDNLDSFPIANGEVDISGSKLMNSTGGPQTLTLGEDYTYENGLLTITNPECVNTVVALLMSDGPAGQGVTTYKYAIFVVEAEDDGGDTPDAPTAAVDSIEMTDGGKVNNYDQDNPVSEPMLDLGGNNSITLTAYNSANEDVTDSVTWSANSENVTVTDGVVTISENAEMTAAVEEITITAAGANGSSAKYTVYLYDAAWHTYYSTKADGSDTYHVFTSSAATYISMGDTQYFCVYKAGSANIYLFDDGGNFSGTVGDYTDRLVESYEAIVANTTSSFHYNCPCPHGDYSGTINPPAATPGLTLDGEDTTIVYPGNQYELVYTDDSGNSKGYTFESSSDNVTVTDGVLTVTENATNGEEITLTVKDSEGNEVASATLTVSHDIVFKVTDAEGEEREIGWGDYVYVGETLAACLGDDIIMSPSITQMADEYTDYGITLNPDNSITFNKGGLPGLMIDASYYTITGSIVVDVLWADTVTVSYSIGNSDEKQLADDMPIFLNQGDTITFYASSDNPNKQLDACKWFIGENGNSPTENSFAFGEFRGTEYPDAGVLSHTDADYTIPGVANMEEQLDYHFSVSADEHNESWFTVIYGVPAITGPDMIAIGSTEHYSTNAHNKRFTYGLADGAPAGVTIDENGYLEVPYEDTIVGQQVIIIAIPDDDSEPLTKTVTIVNYVPEVSWVELKESTLQNSYDEYTRLLGRTGSVTLKAYDQEGAEIANGVKWAPIDWAESMVNVKNGVVTMVEDYYFGTSPIEEAMVYATTTNLDNSSTENVYMYDSDVHEYVDTVNGTTHIFRQKDSADNTYCVYRENASLPYCVLTLEYTGSLTDTDMYTALADAYEQYLRDPANVYDDVTYVGICTNHGEDGSGNYPQDEAPQFAVSNESTGEILGYNLDTGDNTYLKVINPGDELQVTSTRIEGTITWSVTDEDGKTIAIDEDKTTDDQYRSRVFFTVPADAQPNNEITVTQTVTNEGSEPETFSITLKVTDPGPMFMVANMSETAVSGSNLPTGSIVDEHIYPGSTIRVVSSYISNDSDWYIDGYDYTYDTGTNADNTEYCYVEFTIPDWATEGDTIYVQQYANDEYWEIYLHVSEKPVIFTLEHIDGSATYTAEAKAYGEDAETIKVYPGDAFWVTSSVAGELNGEIEHVGFANNGFSADAAADFGLENPNNIKILFFASKAEVGTTATISQEVNGVTYSIKAEVVEETQAVDTFAFDTEKLTETQYFNYYQASDSFTYTVDKEHTIHVSGLTDHESVNADTDKYSIYYNTSANAKEVFMNKLTDAGIEIDEIYVTSAVWNAATEQYDITFTVSKENVAAGVNCIAMRLTSYSSNSSEWTVGPASPYFVISLVNSAA